jgi:hypothetical protein
MLLDCIQKDGQHLPVESWVYYGVVNGTITDPILVQIVRNAIEIREFGWPRLR